MASSSTQGPARRTSAFGRATPHVERVGPTLFVALVLALPACVAGIAWEVRGAAAAGGAAVRIDFVAFRAAAKLAAACCLALREKAAEAPA